MAKRFSVKLEQYKDTQVLQFDLPFDVFDTFGTRARLAVKGTINGFPFRSSIFPRGGGIFYFVVNKEMRDGAKVKAGDVADFIMEKDDTPRTIDTPVDFAKALKANKDAQAAWEKLSYTHRREYIGAIEDAKKAETRLRRIESAVKMIVGLKKTKEPAAKKAAIKSPARKTTIKKTK